MKKTVEKLIEELMKFNPKASVHVRNADAEDELMVFMFDYGGTEGSEYSKENCSEVFIDVYKPEPV